MFAQFAVIIAFAKVTSPRASDDLAGNLGNLAEVSNYVWIGNRRDSELSDYVSEIILVLRPRKRWLHQLQSLLWVCPDYFRPFLFSHILKTRCPSASRGARHRYLILLPQKYVIIFFLMYRPRWPPLEDRRRRDKDMPWAQSHAQDDSGSYGRHLVCS